MNEELQKYQELAKSYLAKKDRVNYYETSSYSDFTDENVGMLVELSDEEVSKIRDLKARYDKDFVNHLGEVFDDEDIISDMFYTEERLDIDLDFVYHQYRFTLSEVNGYQVSSRQVLIQLSDEEYAKLLAWHLYDSHLVINTLFYRDENLARRIMREAMRYKCDDDAPLLSHPYVIVMDEALADADQIRQDKGIKKDEGYLMLYF
jgi:hypothetical protein